MGISDGLVIYGFYNKTLIIVQTFIGFINRQTDIS